MGPCMCVCVCVLLQAYMSSERQGRVLTGKMMDNMYTFAPRPLVSRAVVHLTQMA